MGQSMVGRLAIKARQIQPGDAFAAAVPAGGLVEIVDLEGKQVAELVAFDRADPSERISLGVTRQQSKSIMLSLGMKVYSTRGRAMLDLVEDTVGRHDLLWTSPTGPGTPDPDSPLTPASQGDAPAGAGPDATPTSPAIDPAWTPDVDRMSGHADESPDLPSGEPVAEGDGDRTARGEVDGSGGNGTVASSLDTDSRVLSGFGAALEPFGLATPDVPDPINLFMQVAVMQRGDLELRAPLSERGDRVVLQALTDLIVAVRCSSVNDETNGEAPSDILVRVYR